MEQKTAFQFQMVRNSILMIDFAGRANIYEELIKNLIKETPELINNIGDYFEKKRGEINSVSENTKFNAMMKELRSFEEEKKIFNLEYSRRRTQEEENGLVRSILNKYYPN